MSLNVTGGAGGGGASPAGGAGGSVKIVAGAGGFVDPRLKPDKVYRVIMAALAADPLDAGARAAMRDWRESREKLPL